MRVVGLAPGRHDLDDDGRLGHDGRGKIDRRATDNGVGNGGNLVCQDLHAFHKGVAGSIGERLIERAEDVRLNDGVRLRAGRHERGWPAMNSQASGWRACQASNSATLRGRSSRVAASTITAPGEVSPA
jgi:hypothetical protein